MDEIYNVLIKVIVRMVHHFNEKNKFQKHGKLNMAGFLTALNLMYLQGIKKSFEDIN